MRFESEVIVNDLLPAVRSIVAERLHGDYGFTQEEVAARLEVTQAAVSQYINQQRAEKEVIDLLKNDPQVDILLGDIVSRAANDDSFSGELGQLVETVRDKGLLRERFEGTEKL